MGVGAFAAGGLFFVGASLLANRVIAGFDAGVFIAWGGRWVSGLTRRLLDCVCSSLPRVLDVWFRALRASFFWQSPQKKPKGLAPTSGLRCATTPLTPSSLRGPASTAIHGRHASRGSRPLAPLPDDSTRPSPKGRVDQDHKQDQKPDQSPPSPQPSPTGGEGADRTRFRHLVTPLPLGEGSGVRGGVIGRRAG